MPMQIALRPKPMLAVLAGDPAVLRSLIRPLVALASYQKNRNAEYCTESSSAAVVCARAGAAQASIPSSTTMKRFMKVLSTESGSELDSDRHAVSAAQPAVIGPSVVEMIGVQIELAAESRPDGQAHFGVLL